MRMRLAVAVVVLQLGVLAFMAGEREWILRTGRTVFLRTAPVDPRDPMRGDYVRFDYELARIPKHLCRDGLPKWFESGYPESRRFQDRVVYVTVNRDEEGVAQLVSASDRRPATGEFLRARVQSIDPGMVQLRFGTEAMFTEQGRAREFEVDQSKRPGVPLNIEAAVSPAGLAVMKGYRWEPLGISVVFDRPAPGVPSVQGNPPVAVTGATVELKNYSDRPVAIVLQPEGRSFRLLPNERSGIAQRVHWVGETAPLPTPSADLVQVLPPGGSVKQHVDFTTPAWFVRDTRLPPSSGPVAWSALTNPWGISFRLEYAPPDRAASAGLPQAELLRHARLRSRAFNLVGAVD